MLPFLIAHNDTSYIFQGRMHLIYSSRLIYFKVVTTDPLVLNQRAELL